LNYGISWFLIQVRLVGRDGGNATCLPDDEIAILVDFDPQRTGSGMKIRMQADASGAIAHGRRVVAQYRLKAPALVLVTKSAVNTDRTSPEWAANRATRARSSSVMPEEIAWSR
jgi:hypothetical protein